jgi:hypothetical protein
MTQSTAMEASQAVKNLQLLIAQQQRMMLEERSGIQHTQPVQVGQMHSNSVPGPGQFVARTQHKQKAVHRSNPVKHPKPTSAVPKPSSQEDVQKEYEDQDVLVSNTAVSYSCQGLASI